MCIMMGVNMLNTHPPYFTYQHWTSTDIIGSIGLVCHMSGTYSSNKNCKFLMYKFFFCIYIFFFQYKSIVVATLILQLLFKTIEVFQLGLADWKTDHFNEVWQDSAHFEREVILFFYFM